MDVKINDAVFLVHWVVSRSVSEVCRRSRLPMKAVLTEAARLRADRWAMPYRPLEDTAPKRDRKAVLAPLPEDPDCDAWVDDDGRTWTLAGRIGRKAGCYKCGKAVGPNGYNRLAKGGDPGKRCACAGCVKAVSLPTDAG